MIEQTGPRFPFRFSIILFGAYVFAVTAGCVSQDFRFQEYAPDSGIALGELLDQTPAIKSAFENLSVTETNRRLNEFLSFDPEIGVAGMFALADSASAQSPALPDLMDVLARGAFASWHFHRDNPDALSGAMDIGTDLLDVEPKAVLDLVKTASIMVRYLGNNQDAFAESVGNSFPNQATWSNCAQTEDFENQSDNVIVTDETREQLLSVYEAMRLLYCVYENLEDINAESDDTDDETGKFMRGLLQTMRNDNNAEETLAELIHNSEDEEYLADAEELEQKLADWLIADPDKKFITDFMANELFTAAQKKFIFEEGKPILDVGAQQWSKKDPGNDEYFVHYVARAGVESLPKAAILEEQVSLDPASRLQQNLNDLFTPKDTPGGPVNLDKNNFSLSKALEKFDPGQVGEKFLGRLWSGHTYLPAYGSSSYFPGLLNNIDGLMYTAVQNPSSQEVYNHYRQEMKSKLAAIEDLDFNNTYDGENLLNVFLTNVYLYLLENYYDPGRQKWAVDQADGSEFFDEPARNLSSFLSFFLYNLRNLLALNPCGDEINPLTGEPDTSCNGLPTDHHYGKMSTLQSYLYLMAAGNGIIDPVNSQPVLTLRDVLRSNGSGIIIDEGDPDEGRQIMEVLILEIPVQVACPDEANCTAVARRNGQPYAISLESFAFELAAPGRFLDRTGPAPIWQGRFSDKQGDIETTESKTGNWMMGALSQSAWQGFGPYTYQGKAPNGSKLKYTSEYLTDSYNSDIYHCTAKNFLGFCTDLSAPVYNRMGANAGIPGTVCAEPVCDHHQPGEGRYRMYENIYRPVSAEEPCWSDAGGDTYGYARYGYLRPSENTNYHDAATACDSGPDSYQLNITGDDTKWRRIQVDFDTRDEAIRRNFEWGMLEKKFILIMPMAGIGNIAALGINEGAAFSVYASVAANGLIGISNAKRAGADATFNGTWNNNPSLNMMNASAEGLIENGGNGFIIESDTGGNLISRFGRTSFRQRDSAVILDITGYTWGLSGSLDVIDVSTEAWHVLGDGPLTPAILGDNVSPLIAMASSVYSSEDLLSDPGDATVNDIAKFRKFFDLYFPADNYDSAGVAGSDGNPDLFQKYERSLLFPGCKDTGGDTVAYCITEADMPPVPHSTGISYPKTFDTDAGTITEWYTFDQPSDGKYTKFVTPLIMWTGAIHEDGNIRLSDDTLLGPGENFDDYYPPTAAETQTVFVQNYESDGLRTNLSRMMDLQATFNELVRDASSSSDTTLAGNLPVFKDDALLSVLVDGVQNGGTVVPGDRNGFAVHLLQHPYLNIGDADTLSSDLEEFISLNAASFFDSLPITEGLTNGGAPGPLGELISGKDKLRYFLTPKVTEDVGENYLRYLLIDGKAGEPLTIIRKIIGYLRSLSNDADIVLAVKEGIKAVNKFFEVESISQRLEFSDEDIDDIVNFLNDKNEDDEYVIDSFIDFIIENEVDIDSLRNFDFANLDSFDREELEKNFKELNDALKDNFNEDLQKKILFSSAMLGEPVCDPSEPFRDRLTADEPYYDYNGNGEHDEGTFAFNATSDNEPYILKGSDTFWRNDSGLAPCGSKITVDIPDYFNFHVYNLRIDRAVASLDESILSTTQTDVEDIIDLLYSVDIDQELNDLATETITDALDSGLVSEPYSDRDGDGIIRPAEPYTDGSGEEEPNGEYDNGEVFEDINGNGRWDGAEWTDLNRDGHWTDADGLGFADTNDNGAYDEGIDPFYDRDGSGDYNDADKTTFYSADADGNTEDDYDCYYGGEPFVDLNQNGSFDSGELYFDRNKNGSYDEYLGAGCTGSKPASLRHSLIYLAESAHETYQDLEVDNKYLTILLDFMQNKANPRCGNYPKSAAAAKDMYVFVDECMNGHIQNSAYLTKDLKDHWLSFVDAAAFEGGDLAALKNLAGSFLYDTENRRYTQLLRPAIVHLASMSRKMQGIMQIDGDDNDMIEASLAGFENNGFMHYMLTNLKIQEPYTAHDVLRDLHVLANTEAMRCYPGKTDENGYLLPYCTGLQHNEMFWPQFSELSTTFALLAYRQKNFDWSSEDSDFVIQFANMFEE